MKSKTISQSDFESCFGDPEEIKQKEEDELQKKYGKLRRKLFNKKEFIQKYPKRKFNDKEKIIKKYPVLKKPNNKQEVIKKYGKNI